MHPHLQQMNNKTRHISLVCYTMNLAHANIFAHCSNCLKILLFPEFLVFFLKIDNCKNFWKLES